MRTRALVLAGLIAGLAHTLPAVAALPTFSEVREAHPSCYADLLDHNGQLLQRIRLTPGARRLDWVPLASLSPAMQQALLISEDQRFFRHHGVDWQAVFGAAWENLFYNTHRGASTLTMQLAGLLDPRLSRETGGRSVRQKLRQIAAAQTLERHWDKAQILEAYLNLARFRAGLTGIHAATQGLFGTTPSAIDPAQATLLAALLRGPDVPASVVASRACTLAHRMSAPQPDCQHIRALAARYLTHPPHLQQTPGLASDAARYLLAQPGQRLVTSLDRSLQRSSLEALNEAMPQNGPYSDGAVLIISADSGEILAWATRHAQPASSDPLMQPRLLDQAAWPLLVELAFERGTLQPDQMIDASPLPLLPDPATSPGVTPQPPQTTITVARMLTDGNYPAAWRVLDAVPAPAFSALLPSFGLGLAQPGQPEPIVGNLLALGSAWQTLANHGVETPLSFRPGGLPDRMPTLQSDAVAQLSQLLADPRNHPALQSAAVSARAAWLSGQSGCGQWSLGYTANRVILLWLDVQACRSGPHRPDGFAAWAHLANMLDATQSTDQPYDFSLDPQPGNMLPAPADSFLPRFDGEQSLPAPPPLSDKTDKHPLKY